MLNGLMRSKTQLINGIVTLLIIFVLVNPGTKATLFHGLPLSPLESFLALFFIVTIWMLPWQAQVGRWKLVSGVLIGILLLQLISSQTLPYGWSVCLKRQTSNDPLTTPCEASAEFAKGERSFIVRKIDYTRKNFPLYFMNNSSAFNFLKPGEPDRAAIPYSFEAHTYIAAHADDQIIVRTTIPDVTLSLNDQTHTLPSSGEAVTYSLLEGIQQIKTSYGVARSDTHFITIDLPREPYYKTNTELPATWYVQGVRITMNLLIASLMVVFGLVWIKLVKVLTWRDRIFLGAASLWLIAFWLLRYQGIVPITKNVGFLPFIVPLFCALGYVITRPDKERMALQSWFILFAVLQSAVFITHLYGVYETILFKAGGDELGHEFYARATMLVPDVPSILTATENKTPYYYQPMYRYLLAVVHKVVGEPMWGVYVAQTLLMILVTYLAARFFNKLGRWPLVIMFLASFALFSIQYEISIFDLSQKAFQQAIGLPLFLITVILILQAVMDKDTRWWVHLSFGFLYGLACMTRTDLIPSLPGVGLIYLVLLWQIKTWRERLIIAGSFGLGFLVFPAFVVWRNHTIADVWLLFPTSTTVNLVHTFYDIVPYYDRSITGSKALRMIVEGYAGRHGELISVLLENIKGGFIGTNVLRKILWYGVPVVFFVSVWRRSNIRPLLVGGGVMLVLLIIFNSFFALHNGVAMYGHFDFLLLIILLLSIASWLPRRAKT